MHETLKETALRLPSVPELHEALLSYDWSDLAPHIKRTLFKLLGAYLTSEQCDSDEVQERAELFSDLCILYDTLENLEKLESLTPKNVV